MSKAGLWGWVQDVGRSCGFAPQSQTTPMWVRAQPDLFPNEVPGMSEELLQQVSAPGGSLEEKIETVVDVFRTSARHLESLQQVLRRRALEKRQKDCKQLPRDVEEVISEGTYLESFLEAYDGQSFLLHSEEIVPSHEYRLALEVNSGGAYWKSIPVEGDAVRHKVETVTASSPAEGSVNIISQFGAAQRGAVFVWRWQHVLDAGPYNLPDWLEKALTLEGNDPLRKLQTELEALRRWEHQVQQDACKYIKKNNEIKDVYIREVLRLWPSETDHSGVETCKKCAWVEGLDANLFTGRNVLVQKVPYDANHTYVLYACVARRQVEKDKEQSPPYRLTTSWQWLDLEKACAFEAASPVSRTGTAQSLSVPSREPATPGLREVSRAAVGTGSMPVMSERPHTTGSLLPSMAPTPGSAYTSYELRPAQTAYPTYKPSGGYPMGPPGMMAAQMAPYPGHKVMSGPMPVPTPLAAHMSPGAASPTLAFPSAAVGTR